MDILTLTHTHIINHLNSEPQSEIDVSSLWGNDTSDASVFHTASVVGVVLEF